MPGLVRKILILAAIDGLVLQPAPPRNHRPTTEQAIKVSYDNAAITPLLKDRREEPTAPPTFESYGIIGLLKITSASYLISISDRKQVAQIRGKPIYVISDVALIPLSSQQDAETALVQARDARQRRIREGRDDAAESSDSQEEEDTQTITDVESLPDTSKEASEAGPGSHKRSTSVAEDVINKKGMYGRFAERWFSKTGWKAEGRRQQGLSTQDDVDSPVSKDPKALVTAASSELAEEQDSSAQQDLAEKQAEQKAVGSESSAIALLPRVIRTAKMFFVAKSFFFSYEYDLSRSLSSQHRAGQGLNLHNSFDPLFFWNSHLLKPFANAGQQAFTMPLIQGFVGQRAFALDSTQGPGRGGIVETKSDPEQVIEMQGDEDDPRPPWELKPGQKQFLLTIISRRSVKRAGLRYLRRGVDEYGNVANNVETEQVLSTPSWGEDGSRIYSYVQVRGSIPLFFSQSPYSFKPIPVFSMSEANARAFKLHFQQLANRYGTIQAASLVDKHGTEAGIGEAYEKWASKLNNEDGIDGQGKALDFVWFDFHRVCAGMKFQNVSVLIDTLRPGLEESGWTLEQDGELQRTQTGILRTNCMDCLDRTNVVQSAAGRNALEQQLAEQGFSIDLQTDPTTAWFNSAWADNGDAISREYAGTAALKGDYTRTRKRNIGGALTDFGLTLSRYYNNIVNDYLAQVFIDFALGNADESIFAEFEADMKSQDYAVDLRKVRQNAIDTCTKIVIEDEKEDLVAGWTLSCPRVGNTLRTLPFEECVLLLSQAAIYFCRFDWGTEKVKEFERVELEFLDEVVKGTYITSTLAKRDIDEKRNVGLLLSYRPDGRGIRRINTRSLAASQDEGVSGADVPAPHDPGNASPPNRKFLAFKALPLKSSIASKEGQETRQMDEQAMVNTICDEVARASNDARARNTVPGTVQVEVVDREIISVAEARKSTGYLEQIGYSLKRLVWA